MNLSRNGKWGIAAVVAVALAAAGAAVAATKIHTGGSAGANGRFGGPPPAMGGYGFDRDGDHHGFAPRGPGGELSAAASYLGIGTSTLFQDLRNGKTLAQIADATSGKSASGLIDALVQAAQKRFGDRVDTAQLKARITAMVNGTGFGGPDGDHGGGFGPPGGGDAPTKTTPPTHI